MEDNTSEGVLYIHREGQEAGVIILTKQEGDSIKDLIRENFSFSIPSYCETVGMHHANIYAILAGQRKCTTELLNRLLSGIGYEAICRTGITIQKMPRQDTLESMTGPIVTDADFTQLDEEWQFDETQENES